MKSCTGLLQRFARAERGATLAEFAIMVPLLTTMLMGGVDVARLSYLDQKLDRAASTVADMVSQGQSISAAQMTDIFNSVSPIMDPFPIAPGLIIVTSVAATNGTAAAIEWQQTGGGSLAVNSVIGKPGKPPVLPTGFVVRDGETVIIAESFYNFTPLFLPALILPSQIYHRAMYRPRLGSLLSIS
jgi:Flp pilus assembly pilin Flp